MSSVSCESSFLVGHSLLHPPAGGETSYPLGVKIECDIVSVSTSQELTCHISVAPKVLPIRSWGQQAEFMVQRRPFLREDVSRQEVVEIISGQPFLFLSYTINLLTVRSGVESGTTINPGNEIFIPER